MPPNDEVSDPLTGPVGPTFCEVTLTETVQVDPAATLPPDRLTDELPPAAVTEPPQVLDASGRLFVGKALRGELSTVTPDGRLALKPSAPADTLLPELSTVKVSREIPPCGMLGGE